MKKLITYTLIIIFIGGCSDEKIYDKSDIEIVRDEVDSLTVVTRFFLNGELFSVKFFDKDSNKIYFELLTKFKERTKCPVLVNTSFNIRGEPIVNSPEDAFRCFMGTDLDCLVIGNAYLNKQKQDNTLKTNYTEKFELD